MLEQELVVSAPATCASLRDEEDAGCQRELAKYKILDTDPYSSLCAFSGTDTHLSTVSHVSMT
jgi:hypothetical protein